LFKVRLIICGLKIIGKEHFEKMVADIKRVEADHLDKDMLISGLDLVCEEDHFDPLLKYAEEILDAKSSDGQRIPMFLHGMLNNTFDTHY
jgi:hypothetical protein